MNLESVNVDVCKVGPFTIKHVVKLAKKNIKNRRQTFYSEYEYKSNYYYDVKELVSVKLDINGYLSIEDLNMDWSKRKNLKVTIDNQFKFVKMFKKVRKLYTKLTGFITEPSLTAITNENTIIVKNISETSIACLPTVIKTSDGLEPGINLILNADIDYSYTLTITEFELLYRTIKKFDIYSNNISVINCIGKPSENKIEKGYNNNIIKDHQKKELDPDIQVKGFNRVDTSTSFDGQDFFKKIK